MCDKKAATEKRKEIRKNVEKSVLVMLSVKVESSFLEIPFQDFNLKNLKCPIQ